MGVSGIGRGYSYLYNGQTGGRSTEDDAAGAFADYLNGRKTAVRPYEEAAGDGAEEILPAADRDELRQTILDRMEELREKIKKGELIPSFQIGSGSFTLEEWDEFLEKIDDIQDEMRRQMREETGSAERPAEPEHTGITEEENAGEEMDLEALMAESTMCTYPASDPEEEDVRYITWYTREGIFCRKAGQTESYEWSIFFSEPEQYDQVMTFLEKFSGMDNLRFGAHENFWQDFLEERIDTEDFVDFMQATKDGVPEYTYTVGDSTYIDKEKAKYAPYMNPFGARFYTEEEMLQNLQEQIRENTAKYKSIM